MHKLIVPMLLAALAAGCSSKVQQQRPPRIEDEDESAALASGGEDMAAEEPKTLEPEKEKVVTPEEKKAMCCAECAKGAANDRSGDDPTKIPCADFTADLSKKCLKYFRKSPLMASEAAACAGPPAEQPAADAGGDGAAN